MKKKALLILAHGPPPLHGQSFMVGLTLEALRTAPLRIFHIDCRYSSGLEDLGRGSLLKFLRALRYVVQALWLRFRHGIDALYFIPAPGKRVSVWRDWLVLGLLRPFFPKLILHWHAVGLPAWLRDHATPLERAITERVYRGADLGLSLLAAKREDTAHFHPRAIAIVPNGIPDPCPDFESQILPRRQEQAKPGAPLHLLFLSTASRGKGLFDALEAWRLANLAVPEGFTLDIAGDFPDRAEEASFHEAVAAAQKELTAAGRTQATVRLLGHVTGEAKHRAFAEAGLFLFPSVLPWESFGLVLVEAAHYGLPCLTTQPLVGEGLSPDLHVRVPLRDPAGLAAAILGAREKIGHAAAIRAEALSHFSAEVFGQRVRDVLTANIA